MPAAVRQQSHIDDTPSACAEAKYLPEEKTKYRPEEKNREVRTVRNRGRSIAPLGNRNERRRILEPDAKASSGDDSCIDIRELT